MSELFFTIKTKDSNSVNAVLAKQDSVEFDGLNVLADSLEIGQIIFIVFGGDKPAWETGLVGLGILSKLPYGYEGRNFKVQADIKLLFSHPIKRADLVLYPDTYDIIGIAPITKWEPNQALSQVQTDKAYALLNAIFNLDIEKQKEFEKIFSPVQLAKIKANTYRRYREINPIENHSDKGMKWSKSVPFIINKFTNNSLFVRYIRSLLAKPFVILSGNSGTGKTRIAVRFAQYLGKQTDGGLTNRLLIPVGADWTDNTKILGFYNPLQKTYQSTPVLDFILLARQNPDIPFFLILDEMNLSHVERYFSDFLSAMESAEPIPLYKKGDGVDSDTPEEITLPKNLFVTGTVNIDETTYMFSPKVLDRANVIEFKPEIGDVLGSLTDELNDGNISTAEAGVAEGFMELARKVRSEPILAELKGLLESDATPILRAFYTELEKCGFEFAYRTVKEIRLYAVAAYETCEDTAQFKMTDVVDVQVLQKILPKIHGNRKQIGSLLEELEKLCGEYALPLSLTKIRQMRDKLNRFQYASFI